MIYKLRSAPHIRSVNSNLSVMGDAVVTLIALYFICVFYYGLRTLMLGIASVLACVAADIICNLLRGRHIVIEDLSAVVTGLLTALMLPASAPYYLVISAGAVGICLGKHAFGGLGRNIFNPAAVGLVFAGVCWPSQAYFYPSPFSSIEVFGSVSAKLSEGAAYILSVGGIPSSDRTSVLLGMVQGPMGTTNVLVILACLLFLVMRGTVRWQQTVFTLAAAGLFALIFPRSGLSSLDSLFFELLATPLFFCSVFMFTDPATSPMRDPAKAIYGVLCGIAAMLASRFGVYYISQPFVILAMNAVVPFLDKLVEVKATKERRAAYELQEKKAAESSDS